MHPALIEQLMKYHRDDLLQAATHTPADDDNPRRRWRRRQIIDPEVPAEEDPSPPRPPSPTLDSTPARAQP